MLFGKKAQSDISAILKAFYADVLAPLAKVTVEIVDSAEADALEEQSLAALITTVTKGSISGATASTIATMYVTAKDQAVSNLVAKLPVTPTVEPVQPVTPIPTPAV